MAGTVTLDRPNPADPLAEKTLARRLWAAYLRAGFNRPQFAEAVGVRHQTVVAWDKGEAVPNLIAFQRASELVGYTMDQLVYGHAGRPAARTVEPDLSREGIKALLDELGASSSQRAAVGEHVASPAGMFQPFTRSYVTTFIQAYTGATERGVKHEAALAQAMVAATNARAVTGAVALGAKPLTGARLAELGAEVLGTATHRKPVTTAKPKRKR
jgi:DNA-binding XRE family transcriptional regulator